MISGFPIRLLSLIRCSNDGGQLDHTVEAGGNGGMMKGTATCRDCRTAYRVNDGILEMLDTTALDVESSHERELRDETAGTGYTTYPAWYEADHNSAEIIPTMNALALKGKPTILEFGCGEGKYTSILAGLSEALIAVDFSRESLRALARQLPTGDNVGLVLADITKLRPGEHAFDAALSTLVSNLPTIGHRQSMYRMTGRAIKPGGKFVFGTHHYGYRERLARVEKSGRYKTNGIYRFMFTIRELRAEVEPFFGKIGIRPIQAYVPLARRIRLPLRAQSMILERIPLLRNLGELLLCTAELPRS